jgi:hypothetical protein
MQSTERPLDRPHVIPSPDPVLKPNLLTLSSSSSAAAAYRTVGVEQPERNRASSSLIPCYHRCTSAKLKQKTSIFPFVIERATKTKREKGNSALVFFPRLISPCSLRKIKQKKRRDYNNKR